MKSVRELFLIGAETFAFCAAISTLLAFAGTYERIVDNINKEVNQKVDVSMSFTDYEENKYKIITGASVLSEVTAYDGSFAVRVNNTVINNLPTKTGEPYYQYIQEYGHDLQEMLNIVSISGKYEKACYLDQYGRLQEVRYTLV
ncbi:MAG: hypothetical protein UHN47_03880 [Lachnospiraceae bacterium]|nr:hypothetical protein [Lachnospiraceae bacterium]